jgi:hypothetical protein
MAFDYVSLAIFGEGGVVELPFEAALRSLLRRAGLSMNRAAARFTEARAALTM